MVNFTHIKKLSTMSDEKVAGPFYFKDRNFVKSGYEQRFQQSLLNNLKVDHFNFNGSNLKENRGKSSNVDF